MVTEQRQEAPFSFPLPFLFLFSFSPLVLSLAVIVKCVVRVFLYQCPLCTVPWQYNATSSHVPWHSKSPRLTNFQFPLPTNAYFPTFIPAYTSLYCAKPGLADSLEYSAFLHLQYSYAVVTPTFAIIKCQTLTEPATRHRSQKTRINMVLWIFTHAFSVLLMIEDRDIWLAAVDRKCLSKDNLCTFFVLECIWLIPQKLNEIIREFF